MVTRTIRSVVVAALGFFLAVQPALAACGETGVQLQILGSGGPGASAGRASAGYLVWIDGAGRILVDAGGGIKQRFHASGADLGDVGLLALSHFHPDHAAEVPALLWPQGAALRVAGPSGSSGFPALDDWLDGLFGPRGVFRVLAGRLELDAVTVDVTAGAPAEVWRDGDVRVSGIGVPHADVPAVGYRVDVGDASVAFSSDQNGSDPAFIEFVRDVDVLVVHLGRGEDATGRGAELHARPSVWGALAAEAGVGRLVASHISTSSPQVLADSLAYLRAAYPGPITVGEDLLCVALP
jgi:ribonuclease BN (tRNA processing enzyme)